MRVFHQVLFGFIDKTAPGSLADARRRAVQLPHGRNDSLKVARFCGTTWTMFVILALLVALAVILLLRPWETRGCRWRRDTRQLADGRVMFICVACGAQTALPKGREPKECLAGEQ
ncbi:hypothetical protein [Roseinatronobacter sp. NSM]|uniref:hypothetical protein n=1 Tax=Roseinatronobacter sp. NSM TaxID=3457785 RepID=UPI00403523D9